MQRFFLACLSVLVLYSCNQQSQTNPVNTNDTLGIVAPAMPAIDSSSLELIKKWKGKTAEEVNMFGDSIIAGRLSNLLGQEYLLMKANFNVQTPFEEENGIYNATGCRVHDCPSYQSFVYFDINHNNINIVIMKNKEITFYIEKDTIQLPPRMKKDLEITKGNL
ncbi:MAG: hypothetical protein ABIP35_07075 [Ginsengibacter sp.]